MLSRVKDPYIVWSILGIIHFTYIQYQPKQIKLLGIHFDLFGWPCYYLFAFGQTNANKY